jgi:hypothetical protein
MLDDSANAKTLFVTVRDDDVLMLLRDFLEPLGYKVEYTSEVKTERQGLSPLKGTAGALLFLVLDKINAGVEACAQLGQS